MKITVADTYEEMSKKTADDLMQLLQPKKRVLICTASGDSPAGLYKELVQQIKSKQINISDWFFISLDEWAGMNGNDEGSCRYHLNNELFGPLQLPEERIIFFDGRVNDLDSECVRIENFIIQHGGIDIAIVGLGMNGHVGMNEPGTPHELYSHVAQIDAETQKVGQKYFKEQKQLTHGITLGIASLMKARHVFLMVSGAKKAEIVQKVLEGEISEALPATLLKKHEGLKVYLDKEAASLIHL